MRGAVVRTRQPSHIRSPAPRPCRKLKFAGTGKARAKSVWEEVVVVVAVGPKLAREHLTEIDGGAVGKAPMQGHQWMQRSSRHTHS